MAQEAPANSPRYSQEAAKMPPRCTQDAFEGLSLRPTVGTSNWDTWREYEAWRKLQPSPDLEDPQNLSEWESWKNEQATLIVTGANRTKDKMPNNTVGRCHDVPFTLPPSPCPLHPAPFTLPPLPPLYPAPFLPPTPNPNA